MKANIFHYVACNVLNEYKLYIYKYFKLSASLW